MRCDLLSTGQKRPGKYQYLCAECGRDFWSSQEPPARITRKCVLPDGSPPPPEQGPGTELKKLLAGWGIVAESGCGCDDHAREMNRRGAEWCRENVDVIVGWMREEAAKRKLPFLEIMARLAVERAIKRSVPKE